MLDYAALKNLDKNDLLKVLGLQARRTSSDQIFSAVGLFGAGLLVGAGVALLLAPQSGERLREDIKGRLRANGVDASRDGLSGSIPGLSNVEKTRTL